MLACFVLAKGFIHLYLPSSIFSKESLLYEATLSSLLLRASPLPTPDVYLDPLLELLEVWFGSLDLASHQQVRDLHNQVEGADKDLLLSVVVLHHPTSVVQHFTRLLVSVMSQQKLQMENVGKGLNMAENECW